MRSETTSAKIGASWRSTFGFTLVELIVVITILVILGTVAFLNVGGFSGSARDSARISNLSALKKGLDMHQIRNGTYPLPEGPLNILASGSIIGYQWFAKDQIAGLAKLSVWGTADPADKSIYTTYAVSYDQTKMQVMGFLENGSNVTAFVPSGISALGGLVPLASASSVSDYSTRTPTTQWDALGILLGNSGSSLNQPVQEKYDASSFTGMDLVKTTTLSGYAMVFSKNDTTASIATSGTGAYTGSLFTFAYNKRDDLLSNKALAGNDPSLVGYWDMETLSGTLLKDLSGRGNDGTCYNSGTVVSCWGGNWWPQFVSGNGRSGKSMSFDGVDDWVNLGTGNNGTFSMTWNFSVFMKLKVVTNNVSWQDIIAKRNPDYSFWMDGNWRIELWSKGEINQDYVNWFAMCVPVNSNWYWPNRDCIWPQKYQWTLNNYFSIVGKFDTDLSLYYNGNFLIKKTLTWPIYHTTWNGIVIWKSNVVSENPNIQVDEVRIYNRALSDSEIQTLYNATK